MRSLVCLAVILTTVATSALADDKPKEPLPAPRRADPAPEPLPIVITPYRPVSAYAVWDYYAVDRNGYFKPRVIASPYGAYYPLTGKPYPFTTTNMRNYMPYVTD
jgi:hypothetical protein